MKNDPLSREYYGCVSRFLHWAMAFLVIGMLLLGLMLDDIPGVWKPAAIAMHKSFGILLLGLVFFRLGWKIFREVTLPRITPAWQEYTARVMHFSLYIFMFVMPVSGWAMSSAFGKDVQFFGLFPLPPLVQQDRTLGIFLREVHELAAYLLIALLVGHILAAFYHHVFLKDNILRRMLPSLKKRAY